MAELMGRSLVLGVHAQPIALCGFPKGRARIRQRPQSPVRVFIRSATDFYEFLAEERGGCWWPAILIARNSRRASLG